MSSRLFVGNLPYDATETELRDHFAQVGSVGRVFIPLDRDTGRPRGFAFIEFGAADDAARAIAQLHQKPFKDRPLVVNEARPSDARPPSGPRPPFGGPRPAGVGGPAPGFRPSGPPRPAGPPRPPDSGEGDAAPRRSAPTKSKRRGAGKRGFWEDGPKKEPIPEKRRGQIFGGYEEEEEEESVKPSEDFDDFATSLPDSDDD